MGISKVFFLDEGVEPASFLGSFLSQELSITILTNLISKAGGKVKSSAKKKDLIDRVVRLVELKRINLDDILMAYVKSSRMWLSFRLGACGKTPQMRDPSSLLSEFGKPGWYGPIYDGESTYYIYIKKVTEPLQIDEENNVVLKSRNYRWSVIAKITNQYIALYWYGFGRKENPDRRANQFPFWKYIPNIFEELSHITKSSWETPDLYNLILDKLWKKYLDDENLSESYVWRHLRIKAESSGVALNAKSSPGNSSEFSLEGLLALANKLAESATHSLAKNDKTSAQYDSTDSKIIHETLKTSLLKTLIKEWGAMAYEFQLDRLEEDKTKVVRVFRAYCNFGLREELDTEDALQHLKCFSEYGNSNGALDFLAKEISL